MPPMSDRHREMSDTKPLDLGHSVRHVKNFFRNTGTVIIVLRNILNKYVILSQFNYWVRSLENIG